MTSFWNDVRYAQKLTAPLVRVLRLVDNEKKPAMGYIYEAMDRAKEAIAASFGGETNVDKYNKAFKYIDERWEVQLHRPLHAAGYYLNPAFYYDNKDRIQSDEEVQKGLYDVIVKLVDSQLHDVILKELGSYRTASGLFGIQLAKDSRKTKSLGGGCFKCGATEQGPNGKHHGPKYVLKNDQTQHGGDNGKRYDMVLDGDLDDNQETEGRKRTNRQKADHRRSEDSTHRHGYDDEKNSRRSREDEGRKQESRSHDRYHNIHNIEERSGVREHRDHRSSSSSSRCEGDNRRRSETDRNKREDYHERNSRNRDDVYERKSGDQDDDLYRERKYRDGRRK